MKLFSTSSRGGRIGSIAAIATVVALAATGCAATNGGDSDGNSDSAGTIAFLPKQLNNPYTDVVLGGGEEGAAAIGYDSEVLGPLEASASAQIPFIEQATQQGTNVIVIAAND